VKVLVAVLAAFSGWIQRVLPNYTISTKVHGCTVEKKIFFTVIAMRISLL
jgi:hypothetical protein